MNEHSPVQWPHVYPPREHLDPLKTPSDWIEDEIRFAGHAGKEVRDTIHDDLHGLYRATPYAQLLKAHADLLTEAQINCEVAGGRPLPLRGRALYSGMLLAVRAELTPAPQAVRRQTLHTRNRQVADQIAIGCNQSVRVLERLPMDTRVALGLAALISFVDVPPRDAKRYQLDFMTGYAASYAGIQAFQRGGTATSASV